MTHLEFNYMMPNRHLSGILDEDDTVYDDYDETTIDPGNKLFIIAAIFCAGSLIGLPLFVKFGECLTKNRRKQKDNGDTDSNSNSDGHIDGSSRHLVEYSGGANQPQADWSTLSFLQKCRRASHSTVLFVLHNVIRWRKRGGHGAENMDWRREAVARGMAREARESMYMHRQQDAATATANVNNDNGARVYNSNLGDIAEADADADADELVGDLNRCNSVEPDMSGSAVEIVLSPELKEESENEDENNTSIELHSSEHSSDPNCGYLRKKILFLWTIIKYDNETKRILRLAIPFTFSAIAETMGDLITLGIISQYLGTDSMVAFAMVEIVTGISTEFMGGWVEAISSLGSMAYGARNYELVGQYVQTSCIGFVLCEIPFAFIWGMTIDKIILLMGFEEPVAILAKDFVLVQVGINMMKGVNEAVLDFLEVVEKEAYANVMFCLSSVCQAGLVALFAIEMDANLVILGLVMLTNQAFFFFLNVLIPNKLGWLTHFELGLFGHCSFRNTAMMKELVEVALPLAIGNLLAYAEWEILTVFAAILGPAEAATWAILGFVWDVFESTTEAIGDASEVRCAYQMGKGRPALAKLSAYKSIMLAAIMAMIVTAAFLSVTEYLPGWLTKDATIQGMLVELFPLIALGNITMNMGMVCWALVGAQGRYGLATSIATACSTLVTIPIGAIFTIWLRVDLQGLTFAVVIGYTVTAALLFTTILMSDWEGFSEKIQERMAAEEDSDSDDDSSSSSSSSSSESEHDEIGQGSQHHPITAGYFGVSPGTPEKVIPPPPSIASLPTKPRSLGVKQHKYRTESLPYLPTGCESPPRSPTRMSMNQSPMTPDRKSAPRTPTRNQRSGLRPTTPDQKQAKSLAKLRSLGTLHIGESPGPRSPATPNSPGAASTPGGFCYQVSDHAYSPARSLHGDPASPRVVKGRRRRIH